MARVRGLSEPKIPKKKVERLRTEARFVAEVDHLAGRHGKLQRDHCLFGVRLESEHFDLPRLTAERNWIAKHFKRCTVVVPDHTHHLLMQIKHGLPENLAKQRARRLGQEFLNQCGQIFDNNHDCRFEIKLASEIHRSGNYRTLYNHFSWMLSDNKDFADSVRNWGKLFLNRQDILANIMHVPGNDKDPLYLSMRYLLEELTAFGVLMRGENPAIVHPGDLILFEEIANGTHKQVPKIFQNATAVSLKIKEQGKSRRWISRVKLWKN